MSWVHPTGKKPKTVAIVSLGPTQNVYHANNFQYTPHREKPCEVWTVNKGFRSVVCDLVFIMDDLIGEMNKSSRYHDDIESFSGPVITSIVDVEVLSSYRKTFYEFPFNDVLDYVGYVAGAERAARTGTKKITPADIYNNGIVVGNYLHNSIPFMLAYALFIGVETVYLFGADYTFPGTNAREDDRANCEYWVGLLRARGVDVVVPHETTLLNQSRQPWVYGYGARPPKRRMLDELGMKRLIERHK